MYCYILIIPHYIKKNSNNDNDTHHRPKISDPRDLSSPWWVEIHPTISWRISRLDHRGNTSIYWESQQSDTPKQMCLSETFVEKKPSYATIESWGKSWKFIGIGGKPFFSQALWEDCLWWNSLLKKKKVISASVIDSSSRWQKANGLCHGQLFQSRQWSW